MEIVVIGALVGMASVAGILLARRGRWSQSALNARLDWIFGIALGPFILGLAEVSAFILLPNSSFPIQTGFVVVTCSVLGMLSAYKSRFDPERTPFSEVPFGFRSLAIIVFVAALAVTINCLIFPWYANDALEYIIVARELTIDNRYTTYPLLNPLTTKSGFFGPMTHPPLYPIMIAFFDALSGSNDAGWQAKLIVLWFALAAIALTFGIATTCNNAIAGALSVLLLFSVPILTDGFSTGLIDALPMCGLLVVIAAHIGLINSPIHRGLLLGMALGFALWTHSQAILFIPISIALSFLHYGWRGRKSLSFEIPAMMAVTSLIAAIPYIRNYILFGSPVSDNPAIFAMPLLMWDQYFAALRGFEQFGAKIQYGLLKGWFSVSSFGLLFWAASPGLLLAVVSFARHLPAAAIGTTSDSISSTNKVGAVFLIYYSGVAASLVVGIDLMIRNDRYLLAWIPIIALLGGFGLSAMLQHSVQRVLNRCGNSFIREIFAIFSFFILVGLIALPVISLTSRYLFVNMDREKWLSEALPNLKLAESISSRTPPHAVVLAMRPSDMYYSGRRMVSYLDPRMKAVYLATDVADMERRLKEIGITHIQLPNYFFPAIYRSPLGELTADSRRTTLIDDRAFNQLYALHPHGKDFKIQHKLASNKDWRSTTSVNWPFLRPIIQREEKSYSPGQASKGVSWLGLFQRSFVTEIAMVKGAWLPIDADKELRLDTIVTGNGYIRILVDFGEGQTRLTDFVLAESDQTLQISRRFTAPQGSRFIRVSFDHSGNSSLNLREITISQASDKE